jgi:hypothetical protein
VVVEWIGRFNRHFLSERYDTRQFGPGDELWEDWSRGTD